MKKLFNFLNAGVLLITLSLFACTGENKPANTDSETVDSEKAKMTAEEEATIENLGKPTTYEISIRTGCKDDASTKAAVYLIITGDAGTSDELLLDIPTEQNFNSCSNDVFKIDVPKDLGQLTELQLWHDNAGESPNWLVELVKVQNIRTGVRWMFPCGRWFDKDKFDQKINRRFFPGKMCE